MAQSSKRRKLSQTIPHDYFAEESPVLLNMPQMQKPFDHGWRREIVYREVGGGRNSDVFYIAPCGEQVSSRLEVEKYLSEKSISHLSPDWFSFNNRALVGGGEKETSRISSSVQYQGPWRKSKWSTVVICTRYCPERNNSRPSLQCVSCNAFYHPECVFLSKLEAKKRKDSYTCTHCMLEENPDALKVKIKLADLCPIQKLSFDCLLHIFSYLHTADLCNVSLVCTTWNHVSTQPILWRRVSLQGIDIKNWDTLARWLSHFSTVRLDLRGMIHGRNRDESWLEITSVLRQLTQLRWLDFGLVPARVLHEVSDFLPDLEVLTADWISDLHSDSYLWNHNTRLDIGKLSQLTCLKRLQLRAACAGLMIPAFSFSGGLSSLQSLKQLKKLCMTTFKNISGTEFLFLNSLCQLEELEIGECTNWSSETFECLGSLKQLTSLRLEFGNSEHSDALAIALPRLLRLVHLELIMFGVTAGLQEALQSLPSLQTLSLWPEQTGQDNSYCLNTVCSLCGLKFFDWGVLTGEVAIDSYNVSLFHPTLNDFLSKDAAIIPVAPQLCSDFLKGLSLRKDSNGNVNLSLNQLRCVISRVLPHTDIRVFRVPIGFAQRLYFKV